MSDQQGERVEEATETSGESDVHGSKVEFY